MIPNFLPPQSDHQPPQKAPGSYWKVFPAEKDEVKVPRSEAAAQTANDFQKVARE